MSGATAVTGSTSLEDSRLGKSYRSEGSERIIQVPGYDDCTGFGHDRNIVSVVVARLGADVSNVSNESVIILH